MGTPLKVSDSLFAAARAEAAAENRSITQQVEHWARIGRAVEAAVTHRELRELKTTGEVSAPVFTPAARRREVQALLVRVARDSDRSLAQAAIHESGGPVYASDPTRPGAIVQVLPDGTRRTGRMSGRRFVPDRRKPRSG